MSNTSNFNKVIDLLKKKGFKSSIRLAIMIYLLIRTRVYFTDLLVDLDITPGNLWSHLEKLREDGLIDIKYIITNRPRVVVSITDKGLKETMDLIRSLINVLNKVTQ